MWVESPPYGPLFVLTVLPVVFLVANLPHKHAPTDNISYAVLMPSHGKNADRLERNSCLVLATAAGWSFVPSKLLFDLLAFIHLLASLFLISVGFLVKMIHFYIRALFWTLTLMFYALRSPQFVSRWFIFFFSRNEAVLRFGHKDVLSNRGNLDARGICVCCLCLQTKRPAELLGYEVQSS